MFLVNKTAFKATFLPYLSFINTPFFFYSVQTQKINNKNGSVRLVSREESD